MRPIKSKNYPMAWDELEAILLWRDLEYTLRQITRGMDLPRASVLHHIYKGKKAYAHVAKLQSWKGYDRNKEFARFLEGADWADEENRMEGQEETELHPPGCIEPCCTGTRLRVLGQLDAALQLPECGLCREPKIRSQYA